MYNTFNHARIPSEKADRYAQIDKLQKLYCQKEKEFEAAKRKRIILTFLLFTVAYFILSIKMQKPTGFLDVILNLLFSLFLSLFHFFVNAPIFFHLSNKGGEEAEILDHIKEQITELEIADSIDSRFI